MLFKVKNRNLPNLLFKMFNMKNILSTLILIFVSSALISQSSLTLEDVKAITLENNFGIKIAKNNVQLAENQTDRSVNGFLPTVNAQGGLNGNFGGASQKFNNGMEASFSNAFNWGANASVNADYTLFDKRRDLTLGQLKENLNLSNLQLRQTIEQNLLAVYFSYFQLALQNENVEALQEAIGVSQQRLQRATYALEYGQGTGLEVLNAEVDIKRDSVNLLNALLNVDNEKRNLNAAMGRLSNEDFTIAADTKINTNLNIDELISKAKENNVNLQINRQNLSITEMDLNIIEAEKKPVLSAGASYAFNYSDNATGSFIDQSNSRGLSANVSVFWNLFDGSRDMRKQNTVINLTNLKFQNDQQELELERDINNAWANYKNAIYILGVEQSAVETNQQNFIRTEEQVRVGRLSSLEFRQAQLNLLNAQTSLNNARLNAKLAEIQLLALVGELL